jgi:putative DNA primase/helicase
MNYVERIDFEGIKAAALCSARSLVHNWLPGGRNEGEEYVVINPTRNDKRPGSFKINLKTGQWSDFATTDAKGGDLISLFAYINSVSQGEAAQEIAERLDVPLHKTSGATPQKETTPKIFKWGEEGPPVGRDEIRRHYYPKRENPKLKVKIKKRDGTWTTCYRILRDGVPVGWQYKKPAGFRVTFYFGAARDPKKFFWPEGEKDADTLDGLDLPVFTFGGVGDGLPDEVDRDLKRLTGRLLIILTDNDAPGRTHAQKKAKMAHACGVEHIRTCAFTIRGD